MSYRHSGVSPLWIGDVAENTLYRTNADFLFISAYDQCAFEMHGFCRRLY